MNRSYVLVLTTVMLSSMLVACGGPPKGEFVSPCPEWFVNAPEDPNYLFAPVTTTSKDLGIAISKAKAQGRAELATQLDARVQRLTKTFSEETGIGEDAELLGMFQDVAKVVTSQVLEGSRASKQVTKKEGVLWRACVLMELPIGAFNKALVDRIKAKERMYTRFRASQSFKELEEEAQKYEQYKKEQEQQ